MTPSTHQPWFIFAGGGTGGRLYPALAVVESLREHGAPVDVSFYCTERQVDRDILGENRIDAVPQVVRAFTKKPWQWPGFLSTWQRSVRRCVADFRKRRPAAVVGAGGYASGPPVHAALKLGIPTFLLNPDAVPGRANRHLGGRSGLTRIFAQWDVTLQHFPAVAPVEVTGCPVRSAFRSAGAVDAASLRAEFQLDADRPVLLVTGASQGARTINEAMIRLAGRIAAWGWQVLHLTGSADEQRVREGYARARTPATVLTFTHEMGRAMACCDLLISRAGASTLAEVLALGKPSILLPYPYHRDRHQWYNGKVLADAGAAVLLDDTRETETNARQLEPVLEALLLDDVRRAEMARAAVALDRPDAAAIIAQTLRAEAKLTVAGGCEIGHNQPVKTLSRKTA